MSKNITIIGTGAYGTALANVLADNNHNVVMYGIIEDQVNDINIRNINSVFFKDLQLNNKIKAATDLPAALERTEILILCVPTVALKPVIKDIEKYAKNKMIVVNTAKGLDNENLDLLSKMVIDYFKDSDLLEGYAALFGPSIAVEVANRKPTGVMIASNDLQIANDLCEVFTNEYFYAYPSDDIPGAEVSAALKNVVAIGTGILKGYEAGDNAQASLITIGLNEIYLISKNFDGKLHTAMDFAGLGDLILTASSEQSRNFRLGLLIAQKNDAKQAISDFKLTVEGYHTAKVAKEICDKYSIESIFFELMFNILYNYKNPKALINNVFKEIKFIK